MRLQRLQTRFVLAGGLLVAATVASAIWSAFTFARLSAVVGRTLHESQETIDLAATLADTLEREDDALLLSLTGDVRQAQAGRAAQRRRFEEAYARILPLMDDPEEKEAAALREDAGAYRRAGDALVAAAAEPNGLRVYHEKVNPALRRAVADGERLRELNFASMQEAGVSARDEARRATAVVAGISVAALALSAVVWLRLGRSVLRPVRELTASVEALRGGNFDSRVALSAPDEFGRLAEGFNRLAETLGEYRRSSLGELLVAKMTLEATLNALPDAVLVFDPSGNVVARNTPARAVLQATRSEGAAHLGELPLSDAHREAVQTALRGRPNAPGPTEFHRTLTVPLGGTRRQFVLRAAPIAEFEPRRHGAVLVLEDVTEFPHLDTLRMTLLLLAERADNLGPRQREMITTALQGCEELAATVDELLDLTRIEAGQLRLEEAAVDLYPLIARAVAALRSRFEDAAIDVQVVRASPEAVVRGDPARLGVVLGNALKYTPRGGRVTVRVSPAPPAAGAEGGAVQIAVTDTGPGVPEEFRERVFEKFFRVEHHRPNGPRACAARGSACTCAGKSSRRTAARSAARPATTAAARASPSNSCRSPDCSPARAGRPGKTARPAAGRPGKMP
jgi:NtrC-family two-component system sensor histidine kinase KinB